MARKKSNAIMPRRWSDLMSVQFGRYHISQAAVLGLVDYFHAQGDGLDVQQYVMQSLLDDVASAIVKAGGPSLEFIVESEGRIRADYSAVSPRHNITRFLDRVIRQCLRARADRWLKSPIFSADAPLREHVRQAPLLFEGRKLSEQTARFHLYWDDGYLWDDSPKTDLLYVE